MMRPRRPGPPTASELHRRWLQLVDTDGPFLSVPVLKRVWPQGMPALDADLHAELMAGKRDFEAAWERWSRHSHDPQPHSAANKAYATARDRWVEAILRDVVGWEAAYRTDPAGWPITRAEATSPDRQVRVRASGAGATLSRWTAARSAAAPSPASRAARR